LSHRAGGFFEAYGKIYKIAVPYALKLAQWVLNRIQPLVGQGTLVGSS